MRAQIDPGSGKGLFPLSALPMGSLMPLLFPTFYPLEVTPSPTRPSHGLPGCGVQDPLSLMRSAFACGPQSPFFLYPLVYKT